MQINAVNSSHMLKRSTCFSSVPLEHYMQGSIAKCFKDSLSAQVSQEHQKHLLRI